MSSTTTLTNTTNNTPSSMSIKKVKTNGNGCVNASNTTTTTSTTGTCSHLESFKNNGEGFATLAIIQQYIMSWKTGFISTSKLSTPNCSVCHCYNGRIHLCLQCFHIACWKDNHIIDHFNQSGHHLAIDANLNQIYCNQCKDYIYDQEFDETIDTTKLEFTVSLQDISNPTPKRVKYQAWRPSNEESVIIHKNSNIYQQPFTLLGLRGLNNLGNTCFMNSILQSFIHNPLLRNYFLSDMHSNSRCEKRRERDMYNAINASSNGGGGGGSDGETVGSNTSSLVNSPMNGNGGNYSDSDNNDIYNNYSSSSRDTTSTSNSSICLGCEMDVLFGQVFSGTKIPYTPHQFLYSCWNYSNYFVGYEQQDAHEFLISSLNGIHSHCGGSTNAKENCNCIVHCTFGGQLKSEVTCTSCKFTSSTTDPFIDISLDIPKSKHHHDNNNNNNNHSTGDSLLSCLDRFTQPEKLDEKYFCRQCNTKQESTKQLSFSTLPVVICFHLKRFEQSKTHRRTHKIDTFIEFPLTVDMSPFISKTRKKNLKRKYNNNVDKKQTNNNNNLDDIKDDDTIPISITHVDDSFVYELFAVVNHTGKIDSGHYTSFVKHNDQWYKCDDSMITSSSLQDVVTSKGYLLFYLKKQLEYKKDTKSSSTPSSSSSSSSSLN